MDALLALLAWAVIAFLYLQRQKCIREGRPFLESLPKLRFGDQSKHQRRSVISKNRVKKLTTQPGCNDSKNDRNRELVQLQSPLGVNLYTHNTLLSHRIKKNRAHKTRLVST
ncbi:hypothetical protein Lepto7375DRAFT_4565 [Leptolyngbya sp. PCC 7375]|nr:hypothetical protein Lepto7375DRAFT_4565 [Leptolyngbya sp. PCC 7375]